MTGSSHMYFGVKFSHFTILVGQLLGGLSVHGIFTVLLLQAV